MQRLRRRAGAILIGVNTAIADNPFLVPRPPKGKRPLRIVMDSYLRIRLTSRLLRTTKTSPVMIFTRQDTIMEKSDIADRIIKKGAELVGYPDTHGLSNLHYLLDDLRDRGIGAVLVEGGPTVITSFLKERLADEICIYFAPKILAQKGQVDIAGPIAQLSQATGLHYVNATQFGDDVCISGLTEEGLRGISVGERAEQGK